MSIPWYLFTLDYYIITIQHGIYHIFTISISPNFGKVSTPLCLAVRNMI